MCVGELVGITKRSTLKTLSDATNTGDPVRTSISEEMFRAWNSVLQTTDTDSVHTIRDTESIRQLIRQVCQRRRPGRPPVYVISETGEELKNEQERKFMEKILKRRIRQNRAYRRRKERNSIKKKAMGETTLEEESFPVKKTLSKSSEVSTFQFGEEFLKQPNVHSSVSDKSEYSDNGERQVAPVTESFESQEENQSTVVSLEEDGCRQLKYLWETQEQWEGIASLGRSVTAIRLIFERVKKTYLELTMFLRDAYKSLSIIPGPFDWRTACYVIGISSASEQPGYCILDSLINQEIILIDNGNFHMGPLEKSFALNSSVVTNEPQYQTVMKKAKGRFVEYFLSMYFHISDHVFLQRATAKDIILSIYTSEKVNMDHCLRLLQGNDVAEVLKVDLLNRCVHFFRYCATSETLIAIFKKALNQNASFRSFCFHRNHVTDNSVFKTSCECAEMADSEEIEAIARLKAAIGEAYCNLGDMNTGECLLRQTLELCEFHNIYDSPVLVLPLLYLANLEKKRTFYSTAVEKLNTAVNVLYRLGLRSSPFVTVAFVSGVLLDLQLRNITYMKDSITVMENLPMAGEIPEVSAVLGYLHRWQGNEDVAQRYFQSALKVIQEEAPSTNVSELYIKHCGESCLENVLLTEIEDSCDEKQDKVRNDSPVNSAQEMEQIYGNVNVDNNANCEDSLRCFCFDFKKIGKSLQKMFSCVLSHENSPDYESTFVDDLLEYEDENQLLFNHPFFLA